MTSDCDRRVASADNKGDSMARASRRSVPAERGAAGRAARTSKHTFDAMPDTVDFRDAMYSPALIVVRGETDLAAYRKRKIPVLDQGQEGACTGYGLATVVNYLVKARGGDAKADAASAWMLYTMAKRYDEWPGVE